MASFSATDFQGVEFFISVKLKNVCVGYKMSSKPWVVIAEIYILSELSL